MSNLVTIKEFTEQVWKVERVKLSLGLDEGLLVPPYPYTEALSGNLTINDLIELRINPHIRKALSN
jgi:hypothetical protein